MALPLWVSDGTADWRKGYHRPYRQTRLVATQAVLPSFYHIGREGRGIVVYGVPGVVSNPHDPEQGRVGSLGLELL
jgi:hypothetical protein